MKYITFVFASLFAFTVQAEQISISSSDCALIADYVAGQSVTGKPVVPADLNGGYQINIPSDIQLPINLYLEKDYPIMNSSITYGQIPLAKVEIRNGQVYLNGKPVIDSDVTLLNNACSAVQN